MRDDALNLNGAERYDYRQRGKPPPLNWIMASPLELKKVLGVDELISPDQWRRLQPLLTLPAVLRLQFQHDEALGHGGPVRFRRADDPRGA